jgi:AcrR family transcriptional regulator
LYGKVKWKSALPTASKIQKLLEEPAILGAPLRLRSPHRRDEILAAAASLYITYGPSKTTTRQIAEAVGISQPSLYAHFPTKDALSYALAERSFSILEERLSQFEDLQAGPKAHLEGLIAGYIQYALEEPSAYRIAFMIEMDIHHGDYLCRPNPVGLRAFGIFREKIADLQRQGFLRQGSIDVMAQSIWASMHGLCALLLARPNFPWAEQSALIATHTDLIIRGAQAQRD